MAEVNGYLKDWLIANRAGLNTRFRKAQKRFPRMQSDTVLALMSELLPPLTADADGKTPALLTSAYELILLQTGRGLLNTSASSHAFTAHDILFRETFPKITPLLKLKPQSLPGALSNAVENVKERSIEFVRALTVFGPLVKTAEELQHCGVLLAWRCGEARLREKALELARKIPARAALIALGVADWPDATAPLLIDALAHDAWRTPAQQISPETLRELEKKPRSTAVRKRAAKMRVVNGNWIHTATVGNFAGFGGSFEYMPQLLAAGDRAQRHRFWVRSGDRTLRVDADVFGCVCRPDPEFSAAIQSVDDVQSGFFGALKKAFTGPKSGVSLAPDGTLRIGDESTQIPALAGATTFALCEDVIAFTAPDSFRIRILTTESALQ